MPAAEPLHTYLELRESTAEGEAGAGLSHKAGGLVLLHVVEVAAYGEPKGGVTLVHDAGDHGQRYLAAANVLAEAGWAIALPDLRGHGRSEGPRGHSAGTREVVRDLEEVQQHLGYRLPTAPKALIGQGLGALHALAYALERPGQVAALVLLAPLWSPAFQPPERPSGLRGLFRKLGPTSPGRTGYSPSALTGDETEQRAWSEDELAHDVITLRAAEQATDLARRSRPRLGELGIPLLLLHGADDPIADPEETRRLAGPAIQVRIEPGMRHDLLHDSGRERVLENIAAFLSNATVSRKQGG